MDIDLQGWFTFHKVYDEAIAMAKESERQSPRFAELGVWKGRSLAYLAKRLKETFDEDFCLIAVDTWSDKPRGKDNIAENPELKKFAEAGQTLFGVFYNNMEQLELLDSIVISRESVVAAANGHPPCFFAFIDADHSADAVCADVLAWKDHAHVLAGHDIHEPGVRAGLEKALNGEPYYEMPETLCWTTSKELADRVNARQDVVMLAMPAGATGKTNIATVGAVLNTSTARREVQLKLTGSSILTHHFNNLWCAALNARETHGLTHFVMLHNDIVPQNAMASVWIDLLIDLMAEHDLDVLSAVSPIKDKNGLTSTAIDTDQWRPRRFTMTEIMGFSPTFTMQNLLINTGLMAIRLDQPWSEKVCFHTHDRIVKINSHDNKNEWFQAEVEPEDWAFSRWCNRQGLRIGATREVPLLHLGELPYANSAAWGTMTTDEGNDPGIVKNLRRVTIDE